MTPEADRAVRAGLELVGLVRDYGPDTIHRWISTRDRLALEQTAVALAAMVPEDRTPGELLAWIEPDMPGAVETAEPRRIGLAPCGTHAAFNRHKAAGQEPCSTCLDGERKYQAARARRRRAAAKAAA